MTQTQTIVLTKKQEAKVVAFVAAAREAKSNNKLNGEKVHDNAAILAIANTHKEAAITLANREAKKADENAYMHKYEPWICVPRFADDAIANAIAAQPKRKSGKSKPVATVPQPSGKATYYDDGKGKGWQARSARRANKSGGIDPLSVNEADLHGNQPDTLTLAGVNAKVDSLDAKLDAILAKLDK